MELLKSQKAYLYDIIAANMFSPFLFELKDVIGASNNKITSVTYKHSNYYYMINASETQFLLNCSPGENALTESSQVSTWAHASTYFNRWLTNLRREIEVIDKWKQLEEQMPDISIIQDGNNGKFTFNEFIQVETKINLLKLRILEIPLEPEQIRVLNDKLDYCIELAKSANKFDWGSYFLGVITNIILTLSVTPANAHMIWQAVRHVFDSFLLN